MAIEHTSDGADDPHYADEGTEHRGADRIPPPDRPGQPGHPSRADSKRAAMEANEKPPDAATETADDKPDPMSPRDSTEQQELATEAKADTAESDKDQDAAEETDQKPADRPDSPLEGRPSYGGFDNQAQESEARVKSRENVEEFNTEPPKDQADESSEPELAELPDTSEAEEHPEGDEPGSWRGKGDQYLNAEENLASEHALDRIQGKESKITHDLKSIESETEGKLVGLENRLKGEGRFKEKVAKNTRENPNLSIDNIAEAQHDAIRYTYQFDKGHYVQGHEDVIQRLQDRGYEPMLSRNSWDSPDYKGINTRWTTPEGQLFEVQFHTPESFAAKQETHEAYERLRTPGISKQEHERSEAYQQEVTAGIPIPDGVDRIKDFKRS